VKTAVKMGVRDALHQMAELAAGGVYLKAGSLSGFKPEGGWRPYEFGEMPSDWIEVLRKHAGSGLRYVVYSYDTPIAWHRANGVWVIPDHFYNPTTRQHQYGCRAAAGHEEFTKLPELSAVEVGK